VVVCLVKILMAVVALAHMTSVRPVLARAGFDNSPGGLLDAVSAGLRDVMHFDVEVAVIGLVAFGTALLLTWRTRLAARTWSVVGILLAGIVATLSLASWPYSFGEDVGSSQTVTEVTDRLLVGWYDNATSVVTGLVIVGAIYVVVELIRGDSSDFYRRGLLGRADADRYDLGEVLRRRREAQPGD
jgi:hypothetical protein